MLKRKSKVALRSAKAKEYPVELEKLNRNYEKNGEKDKKHSEDDMNQFYYKQKLRRYLLHFPNCFFE